MKNRSFFLGIVFSLSYFSLAESQTIEYTVNTTSNDVSQSGTLANTIEMINKNNTTGGDDNYVHFDIPPPSNTIIGSYQLNTNKFVTFDLICNSCSDPIYLSANSKENPFIVNGNLSTFSSFNWFGSYFEVNGNNYSGLKVNGKFINQNNLLDTQITVKKGSGSSSSPILNLENATNQSARLTVILNDTALLKIKRGNNLDDTVHSSVLQVNSGANPTIQVDGSTAFSDNFTFKYGGNSTILFSIGSNYYISIPNFYPIDNTAGDVIINTSSNPNVQIKNIKFTNNSIFLRTGLTGTSDLNLSADEKFSGKCYYQGTNTYTGATSINRVGLYVQPYTQSSASLGQTNQPIYLNSYDSFLQVEPFATVFASTISGGSNGAGTFTFNGGTAQVNSFDNINVAVYENSTASVANTTLSSPNIYYLLYKNNTPKTLSLTGNFNLETTTNANNTAEGVTLKLLVDDEYYSSENYTPFLTASSVTGTFANIDPSSELLTVNLEYLPAQINIKVNSKSVASIPIKGNAKKLAQAIDAAIASGSSSAKAFFGKLVPLSVNQIQSVLNQVQPSMNKAYALVQENNAVKVIDSLSIRFQRELDSFFCRNISKQQEESTSSCKTDAKTFHGWVSGIGDNLHQKHPKKYAVGYQANTGGITGGIDYHFSDLFYVGAIGAYTSSDLSFQQDRGSGNLYTGYAGLYFSAISKMFYANASVLGGWSTYEQKRNIFFPTNEYYAKNTHGGSQILSHVDTGVNFGWKNFRIRPFNAFDYISQNEKGFLQKSNFVSNLYIQSSNEIMLRNELGISFASCLCFAGGQWTLSPKISWVREVRVKGKTTQAYIAGTDAKFTVNGFFPSRSLVSPGVNIQGNFLKDLITVSLYYNGEYQGNFSDYSYGGQLRFGF